jgi:hypothetical protein
MTWAEFRIRLIGYQRVQKRLDYRQRDIMYQIYVSNWDNPKKRPVNKDKFWRLDDTELKNRRRRAEKLQRAREQYLKEKNARAKNTDRS